MSKGFGVTNSMSKVLVISYAFPPIPYSGTYRVLRICKGLAELGVEVHALTIKIDARIPNDFDLLAKVPEQVKIHRTNIIDPWVSYQRWKKNMGNKDLSGPLKRATSLLMRIISLPDHQIFWIPFAASEALKVIKSHNIRTVLVTAPPNSSLLVGLVLKKLAGVRYIADLRDPIVGNIATVHLINPSNVLSKIEKRILSYIEKLVVMQTDIILANTETHRKELAEKYNWGTILTMRNCFDQDDFNDVNKDRYDEFTVAHVGSMYGLRKADLLFEAVKRLEAEIGSDALKLRVLFLGLNDANLTRSIDKYGVRPYVRVRGMVSHREAIEMMMRAHLLLLVKATGEGGVGQIPAKFFEYLGTGNRILCIADQESEVAEIIEKEKCGYVVQNAGDAFEALKSEYKNFNNGYGATPRGIQNKNFELRQLAKDVAKCID